MNLVTHKTRLLSVSDGLPRITGTAINYCIILNPEVEISNYNYKLILPRTTIMLNDYREVLKNNFKINGETVNDFEIMAASKDLINEARNLKFKNKNVSISKLGNHELISELLIKTPLFHDKDSIRDGLFLLKLKEHVKDYGQVSPHNLIDDAVRVNESLGLIKPLKKFKKNPVFLKINDNIRVAALSDDLEFIKKHLLIKHYKSNARLSFSNYGEPPLYSLGELGLLTNELIKLWM